MSMSFLGQSPVNSNTGTPYQRIIEPSQLGLFLNLEQSELLRIKRYHEHWRFYIGQHWKFTREDGEPLVTLNYTRALVDKSVAWLVGAGQTIQVPEVLNDYTLPVLKEVWGYNNEAQTLYNLATIGAVTGDAFVLVTYAEATAQAKRINPHTKGQIRIQVLNSEQVYPQWDPLDTNVLTSVRIETIFYDDRSQTMEDAQDHQARQLHTRRFSQVITADAIVEQYQGSEPVTKPNPLGEIPLVHIKNHAVPGEYYGLGDMDSLIDLNRELNEKATDISDIINYTAAPITVVIGAKVKNLERSAKNIWSGLPSGSNVFSLNSNADLSSSLNYMDRIKKAMLEIAGVPEGSMGSMQPISNTSGVALHTQYQPLMEKTDRKRSTYQPGLQDVNYFILRIMEVVNPTTFKLRTDLCKACGGRIVEVTDEKGITRKRCYMIDKQTFEFMKPADVKVSFVRQYSFGKKTEEAPYKQVLAETGKIGQSFWDPELVTTSEAKRAEQQSVRPSLEAGVEQTVLLPSEPPQMDATTIDVPAEPEEVRLIRVTYDVATGQTMAGTEETVLLVPTRCERPEYLNPYENTVVLNDTVPKDRQLQIQLYKDYLAEGLVTKDWCRRQIPDIEDPAQMELDLIKEKVKAKEGGDLPGALTSSVGSGTPDELGRTVGPPFGSNLPG